MPVIKAQSWMPDRADLGSAGMRLAENCVPAGNGYDPMPQWGSITGSTTDYPRGAIDVRDKDLNVYQFVGDEEKLYELTGTTWGDVSLVGGYSTAAGERWEFEQWKNTVIATNWTDDPQVITLGGTNFADLTTDLRARHVARIDQHVVFANTYDSVDGNVPDRVWTSAYDDHTDYTPDSTTGASVRDLGGGPIERIFGGEFGVILCRDKVYRMQWSGAPTWFQIDETITGIGTVAPGACCQFGTDIYTLSQHGFYRIVNGSQAIPIGSDGDGSIVDTFMLDDLDSDYLHLVSCVADPASGRIFWAYPGPGSSDSASKIICYDSKSGKWSLIDYEVTLLWRAGGVGYTVETLDNVSTSLDALPSSLDSSAWKGDGIGALAAFDGNYEHGFFNGNPMTARFESQEIEFSDGGHSMLMRFTPLVDRGTARGTVYWRNSLRDPFKNVAVRDENRWGRVPARAKGRYHFLVVECSGEWRHFMGVARWKEGRQTNRKSRLI